MQRRKFIKNVAGTAVLGGLLGTSVSSVLASSQKQNEKMIVHYVLFWLREDLSQQEIKDFTGFFEELKKIPSASLQYGPPAKTNARGVVDNSFSYNLLVQFKSMEDIAVYETHPIHLAAIEKYSKNWTKVVVHDSVL